MANPLPRPASDVLARRLDRAGVLVHLPSNRLFELNETGMRIWELLGEGTERDQLVDRLVQEFDIDLETAGRSLSAFLTHLEGEGLLQ